MGSNPAATRFRHCPADQCRFGSAVVRAFQGALRVRSADLGIQAAARGGGVNFSAGKTAAAVFGAGTGRDVSVTRNPASPAAATAKPIPTKIGRTSDLRGAGITLVDAVAIGPFAGGSRPGSSGGGRSCRQVGYGSCPANRTRPSYSLCARTAPSRARQEQQSYH